jgi:hypothetical protein
VVPFGLSERERSMERVYSSLDDDVRTARRVNYIRPEARMTIRSLGVVSLSILFSGGLALAQSRGAVAPSGTPSVPGNALPVPGAPPSQGTNQPRSPGSSTPNPNNPQQQQPNNSPNNSQGRAPTTGTSGSTAQTPTNPRNGVDQTQSRRQGDQTQDRRAADQQAQDQTQQVQQ